MPSQTVAARRSRIPAGPRVHIPAWAAKVGMAVTGIIFTVFVFAHMVGNLKVYQGAEAFDSYARWLRTAFTPLLPESGLLWILRVVLGVSLVLHVGFAVLLLARARRARGGHAARPRWTTLSLSARTMLLTGVVLLAFVVFHILDLTIGTTPVAAPEFTPGSAHANLVASMQRPAAAIIYLVTMLFLAVHVLHGVVTAVSDLGGTGVRIRKTAATAAWLTAAAVALGNASIPVAVWAGWVS